MLNASTPLPAAFLKPFPYRNGHFRHAPDSGAAPAPESDPVTAQEPTQRRRPGSHPWQRRAAKVAADAVLRSDRVLCRSPVAAALDAVAKEQQLAAALGSGRLVARLLRSSHGLRASSRHSPRLLLLLDLCCWLLTGTAEAEAVSLVLRLRLRTARQRLQELAALPPPLQTSSGSKEAAAARKPKQPPIPGGGGGAAVDQIGGPSIFPKASAKRATAAARRQGRAAAQATATAAAAATATDPIW